MPLANGVTKILSRYGIERFEIVEHDDHTCILRTDAPVEMRMLIELDGVSPAGVRWFWQLIPKPVSPLDLPNVDAPNDSQPALPGFEATKHDKAKPMMGLISSRFLKGLAEVLTFGATKYAAHNWRKGFALSRPYNALQRHLTDWNGGKNIDEESGLPILYHAACELMFLAELAETMPYLDDRFETIQAIRSVEQLITNGMPHTQTAVPSYHPVKGEWLQVDTEDGKTVAAFVPEAIQGENVPEFYVPAQRS